MFMIVNDLLPSIRHQLSFMYVCEMNIYLKTSS